MPLSPIQEKPTEERKASEIEAVNRMAIAGYSLMERARQLPIEITKEEWDAGEDGLYDDSGIGILRITTSEGIQYQLRGFLAKKDIKPGRQLYGRENIELMVSSPEGAKTTFRKWRGGKMTDTGDWLPLVAEIVTAPGAEAIPLDDELRDMVIDTTIRSLNAEVTAMEDHFGDIEAAATSERGQAVAQALHTLFPQGLS